MTPASDSGTLFMDSLRLRKVIQPIWKKGENQEEGLRFSRMVREEAETEVDRQVMILSRYSRLIWKFRHRA